MVVRLVASWCHGLRPTATSTTRPPGTLMCGTWKPRLRGECECTYMSVRHVHRSLPAVVQLLHVCLLIQLKFCPKRNVLAQVPSVHG